MKKTRLDQLFIDKNLVDNRSEAQRLIRAGKVLIREEVVDKPGIKVSDEYPIRIITPKCPFVGRGGLKLEAALKQFAIDPTGLIAADLGASTGGFTDCLLQNGIQKVYAIDVGHGQLAYSLQIDNRVVVMDKTNCRHLTAQDLGETVDIIVADLSFISIRTVFPAIKRLLKDNGFALLLIKPQFEIGKGRVGKKGIVRKSEDHIEVLQQFLDFFQKENWSVAGATPSPITGKSGNIEFLLYVTPMPINGCVTIEDIQTIASEAHNNNVGQKDGKK